ncbi:MAG: pyruvate synthase [bacterium]|nr:pyruvate synthase [bacterium]
MANYIEIKWLGSAGQGVVTAAGVLAEILALEGKYVQAFPEYIAQKQRPSIQAFNRLSESPIKTNAAVDNAGTTVLMDARLLLNTDVKENTLENAAYIVNTAYNADFIKEKLNISGEDKIFTLDADTIANEEIGRPIPNIPLMTIVLDSLQLITMDVFKQRLQESLSVKLEPQLVDANIRTVERALNEVKRL